MLYEIGNKTYYTQLYKISTDSTVKRHNRTSTRAFPFHHTQIPHIYTTSPSELIHTQLVCEIPHSAEAELERLHIKTI